MRCEVCNNPANNWYNVLREIAPIADEDGQLWARYKQVSGPHPRCNDHRMPLCENIISERRYNQPNLWRDTIEGEAELRATGGII